MPKNAVKTSLSKSKFTGYLTNVTKSIGYASFNKVKNMNPTVSDFSESNNDLFKNIYRNAIDYRTTYRRGLDSFKKTKFYEAGEIGIKALKDDIKTGNLYNVERVRQIEDKMADSFMGGEESFDLGGLDDWGNDFTFDETMPDSTPLDQTKVDLTPGDKMITSSIEGASQANANAISMAIARGTEYQSEISIRNTNLIYTHNVKAFGMMNSQLDAMNRNFGSMMQYMDKNLTNHLKNSTDFYSNITPMMQDQVALLRQIAENTKPKVEEKKDNYSNKKAGYSDIVDANGVPNFDEYGKRIAKNVVNYMNEKTMGMGGLLNSLGDDTNILSAFAANPYGYALDALMNKLTPKAIERSFNELNKSLAGFFGSYITKMNTMSNDSEGNMISQALGSILGVKSQRKTSIDVSMYNKGKVDWNGKSEKALTELIPGQLNKIISLLSGKEETTYDYKKGKYVTMGELKKEYDNFENSFWKNASSDIIDSMNNVVKENMAFNNKKERDELLKDIENMFKSLYENNKLLDINNKSLKDEYYDYDVSSSKNMAAIQSIAKAIDKSKWHSYNNSMNEEYTRQRDEYIKNEIDGRFNILLNNSGYNEFAKNIGKEKNNKVVKTPFNQSSLLDTKDNTGHNLFWYMQNMYKELNYIRRFGGPGNGSSSQFINDDVLLEGDSLDRPISLGSNNYNYISERLIRNKNDGKDNPNTIRRNREEADNRRFLREQAKKMDSTKRDYSSLVNISDLEDDEIYGKISNNLEKNKIRKELLENKDKKDNLLERVLAAKTLSEKSQTIVERVDELSKKPMMYLQNVIDKADQHFFELIYGKEGLGEEKKVKGFLDAMIFKLNKAFINYNNFMEEKILNPLKDKIGIDEDKSLFKGLFEKFEINEKKENAKKFLIKSLAPVKDNLKAVYSDVKKTVSETLNEIINPISTKFKRKNQFKRNQRDLIEEGYEEITPDDVLSINNRYNTDNYKNASYYGKIHIRRNQIEKYKNGLNDPKRKMLQAKLNGLEKRLLNIDKNTEHFEEIKTYKEYENKVKTLNSKIESVKNELESLSKNPNANPTVIENLNLRLSRLQDKLSREQSNYETFIGSNPNVSNYAKMYDKNKEKLQSKIDNMKYENGLYNEDEIKSFKRDMYNDAQSYVASSDYKNLPQQDKEYRINEINNGNNYNSLQNQKSEIERKIAEYERLDKLSINDPRLNTKKDKFGNIRKVNYKKLIQLEKSKLSKINNKLSNGQRLNIRNTDIDYKTEYKTKYMNDLSNIESLSNDDLGSIDRMFNTLFDNRNMTDKNNFNNVTIGELLSTQPKVLESLLKRQSSLESKQYGKNTPGFKVLENTKGKIGNVNNSYTKLMNLVKSEFGDNYESATLSDVIGSLSKEKKQSQWAKDVQDGGSKFSTLPEDPGERQVINNVMNGLSNDISSTIQSYFRKLGVPGFAKGGRIHKDQLAVVGKGEYVLSKEKQQSLSRILGDKIRELGTSKEGIIGRDNLNNEARDLYTRMVYELGAENVDPNIIMGLLSEAGDAGKAFSELQTRDESMKIAEMVNRVKHAMSQRNEGKIDNSGNYSKESKDSGVQNVFSETFKVYKRTLEKTMNVLYGNDPEKERKVSFNGIQGVMKDAKLYGSELVTGGLLGAGTSLLTGFLGGPLLGAGVGASIALARRSEGVQNLLFGEQEIDKDGNAKGRKGGIVPANVVNKVGKLFPDLKKYGITGAVTGLLPLVPFGPVGGLMLGSGVAFAKNSATVQDKLFGESGILDKAKLNKFNDRLPNILAGAGIGLGSTILGLSTPFGLMGNILIGSGIGFASKTDKFQKLLFGEYDETKKEYVGGIVPYVKDKVIEPIGNKLHSGIDKLFDWVKRDVLDPVASSVKPLTKQVQLMFKATIGKMGKGILGMLDKTLGVPVREYVGGFLKKAFSPFKNFGSKLIRGTGKVISSPFRAVGALGRVAKRHQIKTGNADYMTAQERLNFMDKENDLGFFYNEGMNQMNQNRKTVSKEMRTRFGNKQMLKLQGLLRFGEYDKAEELIKKNFGDIRDEESIGIMNSMLTNVREYKDLNGGRMSLNTYGEKKQMSSKIESQYKQQWEDYNKRNSGSKVSFEEFMHLVGGKKYEKSRKSYNLRSVDETIAGSTNDQINNLTNYWNSINTTDKEYTKKKRDTGKQISKLLKDDSLNLSKKQRSIILESLDNGNYDNAISYLNKVMNEQGVKAENYDKLDEARRLLSDFKVTDSLRVDKDKTKNEMDTLLNQLFGGDVSFLGKDISKEDFFNRVMSENTLRRRKGIVVDNDAVRDNNVQDNVTIITDKIISITDNIKANKETSVKILELMNYKYNQQSAKDGRDTEKNILDNKVYRSEQSLSNENKERVNLLDKLGYNLNNAPRHLNLMPINKLKNVVDSQLSTMSDEDKDSFEMAKSSGYKNTPEFMKKMTEENKKNYENYKKLLNRNVGQGDGEVVKSSLDSEGNEVRMKKDSKSGQYEADTSDTSTKRSIENAKNLRMSQMSFYEKFNNLFNKEEEAEVEEKKSGGWLPKILAALGLGKSLLGGITGVLKKGLIGGLFTRGLFGAVGKGALVLGGLMYLPQILDLFKTNIAPALNESWKSDIKPWLENDAVPMLKDGLVTLVKEMPSLLSGTISFIGNELIPSILKGFGWGDQTGDGEFTGADSSLVVGNAVVRSGVKKGAKLAANGGAGLVEASVRGGAKVTAGGVFRSAKNLVRHPFKSTKKAFTAITDKAGMGFGKAFMKADNAGGIQKAMATLDESIVGKAVRSAKDKLVSILSDSKIVNLLGSSKGVSVAKELVEKFVPKLIKEVSEKAAKNATKVLLRFGGGITTGGLVTLGFGVYDFISGFNSAENILGITSEATFAQKILAAVTKTVQGISIIGVLIPTSTVIDLLIPILSAIGVNMDGLEEERTKAKQEVESYNKENNTNYNTEEYNKEVKGKKTVFEKAKDLVTNTYTKVDNFLVKHNMGNSTSKLQDSQGVTGKGEATYGKGEADIANGNPYFSQKNASGSLHNMISDAGCGPTATAMALSKVTGKNVTPESVASNGLKSGSWDSAGARGSLFSNEANKLGVKTLDANGNFEKFDKLVSAGIPTAVSGTLGKGDGDSPYTSAGHIVTVFGKDKNGNYIVNDPRGKQYSGSYTKEQLMDGFNNSWSFGKGDSTVRTDTVPESKNMLNRSRFINKSVFSNTTNASMGALNYMSNSIKGTGLVESAGKAIEQMFVKLFNNDTISKLLGMASGGQYTASSMLLINFVPQVIKKLKQQCEGNLNGNLYNYLSVIISSCNISNMSFLVNDFISGFNNPQNNIGKYDTYTTGMKVCSGIISIVNNRLVTDRILTSNDWTKLLSDYVMPIFGESQSDIRNIKTEADKVIKEYTIKASSSQAQKNAISSIASNSVSDNNGVFSKIGNTLSNVTSSIGGKIKSVANGVSNVVGNIGSSIGSAFKGITSFIGGLFGNAGKGKSDDRSVASVGSTDDSILGVNNFPYYSQHADYSNKKPKLSDAGCGPTSAAMVLSKVTGKHITPNVIADQSESVGMYNSNGSARALFPYLGSKYGVNVKSITDFDQLKQYADKGVPMVISGQGGQLYGNDGHIMASFGKTKNGYIINDPNAVNDSGAYTEMELKNGFRQAWVFGNKGFKDDVKDAEIIMGDKPKGNVTLTTDEVNTINTLYGKGDPSLQYVNGFPYWSQVDFGGDIKDAGCGPTAAAMALTAISNQTVNPRDLVNKSAKQGYWSANAGVTKAYSLFPYLAKLYGTDSETLDSISEVTKYAKQGYPVIIDGRVENRSIESPYTPNGHYSTLFGMSDDKYVANDPRGIKYSGLRTKDQISSGFKYAFKMGDKTFSVDKSKLKELGSSDGATSSGEVSSSEENTKPTATDFFSDMASAAVNFGKKLFGFPVEEDGAATSPDDSGNTPSGSLNTEGFTDPAGESHAGKLIGNDFWITCYGSYEHSENLQTASGARPTSGRTIAVGGKQYFNEKSPLAKGKKVVIKFPDGKYGIFIVEDNNGKNTSYNGGHWIDIFTDSQEQTNQLGGSLKGLSVYEYSEGKGEGDPILYGTGENVKLGSKLAEYGLSFLDKGFYYSQANRQFINNNKNASDCSSYTNHIYNRVADKNIGSNTREQYKSGSNISKKDLVPSDVVLFKNTYSGASKSHGGVSHSAMYLGDNKFIHSSTRGIRIDELDSKYWKPKWLTGKRFVDPNKMVDGKVDNPNKLTNFKSATGTYNIPGSAQAGGSSDNTNSESTETTSSDFFSDMASAGLNFSKKLFGFETDNTESVSEGSGSSDDTSLNGSSIAEKIYNFGISKGCTPQASAGLVGNADCESSFDPKSVNNIGASGLFQWLDGRLNNLKSYASSSGKDWTDVDSQVNFMWKELNGADPTTLSILNKRVGGVDGYKKLTSPYKAGYEFGRAFERGGHYEKRGKVSEKWYNKLSVGKGDDIDSYFENTLNGVKTSDFGLRDNEFHTGVDYGADENSPIYSPIDGKVVENIEDKKYGFGNTVVVRDKNNKDHRFAHMNSQSLFGLGSKVKKNDMIGRVGSSGRSTGSHLHYEVTNNKGISVNPKDYNKNTGGSENKIEDAVLSFKDSNQKVNVSTTGKGEGNISEKSLVRLINVVIGVLTKISDNTNNINTLVELLKEINTKGTNSAKSKSVNKYSSDTSKSKSQKLLNTLQKTLNTNDTDVTNMEYILSTLEKLAIE